MFNNPAPEIQLYERKLIKKIFYDEKTGYYIAASNGETVEIKQSILPILGDVTIAGHIEPNVKYGGDKLVAKKVFIKNPEDAISILLANGFLTGIKREKATEMLRVLGNKVFTVLDAAIQENLEDQMIEWNGTKMHASNVLQRVKGVGPIVAEQIISSYAKKRSRMSVSLLAIQAGLNMYQFQNALRLMSNSDFTYCINNNPYKLSIVPGFDWETVDMIAHLKWEGKEPVDHDSVERYGAAMREIILRHYEKGNMVVEANQAIREAIALARPNKDYWNILKEYLEQEELIILDYNGEVHITTKKQFEIENETAKKLANIMVTPFESDFDFSNIDVQKYSDLQLSEEQLQAVYMALNSNISVVTGGPGTGKTSGFLRTFINVLEKHGLTYTLVAPTGKAAIRMTESVERTAGTIHREFRLFENPPATCVTDYLIVDEASMNSSEIMHKLSMIVVPGKRLVLIGDRDQLPPVGAGEPLMQMIDSGIVPVTKLKTIYRQGKNSGIVLAAHAINNGSMPQDSENNDFFVIKTTRSVVMREVIKQITYLRSIGYGLEDMVVLTPVNKNTFGRFTLNKDLQEFWNPTGVPVAGTYFRLADPVIQNKNDYEIMVMNGQMGIIVDAPTDENNNSLSVMFDEEEKPIMSVLFEMTDEPIGITKAMSMKLESAYALTIHKTQGSQYKAVIVLAPPVYKEFFLRQLIYTGVTRASEICILVDVENSLHYYVENTKKLRRKSLLGEMLTYYMKG